MDITKNKLHPYCQKVSDELWQLQLCKKSGFWVSQIICQKHCQGNWNQFRKNSGLKPLTDKEKVTVKKSSCNNCGKIINILKGISKAVLIRITNKSVEDFIYIRSEICSKCEYRTFLDGVQWAIGLTQKKDLPINHIPGRFDFMWCAKCKCCIEAKITVKKEECIIGKWKKEISV